jgi:glycosyltransferase involved in cell wall biosynthesis
MNKIISAEHAGPLAFFDFVTHYGGSSQSTVLLLQELRCLTDVEVIDIYGTCDKYVADLKEVGVTPIVLFPDWSGRTTIGGRKGIQRLARISFAIPHMMKVVSRLGKLLREVKPRAIWVNSEKALFVAWLAVPQDLPMAIYIRGEMWSITPYCAFAWRRVDAAVGLSVKCLQYLRSTRYAHGNLQVVYSGIDVDNTLDRASLEPEDLPCNNPEALNLVFPATLKPEKGHEFGIRAIARFIESGGRANLWVCGDVPPGVSLEFYQKMQRLTTDLEMQEYVHFLGWRDDILSVMAKSDIVFLPTAYREGIPRSLLEAMALAKPIITTRAGGIPELVRDGTDAILVNQGDVEAVVEALNRLSDPDIRERMGHSGQRRVRGSFPLSRQAKQFLSIMNTLAEGRRLGGMSR